MTSRQECDEAFRLLGYPKFERRPTSEIHQKVNSVESILSDFMVFSGESEKISSSFLVLPSIIDPPTPTSPSTSLPTPSPPPKVCLLDDSQKLQLINAQRCNGICTDNDSPSECQDKLQLAFDKVQSFELSNVFPELCLYTLRVVSETSNIIAEPVDTGTWWYQTRLKPKCRESFLIDFVHQYGFWFYTQLLFPTNLNAWKVKYLVTSETEKEIFTIKKSFAK